MGSKQQHTHAPDRTTLLKCGIGWIWLDITMTCVTRPGVSECSSCAWLLRGYGPHKMSKETQTKSCDIFQPWVPTSLVSDPCVFERYESSTRFLHHRAEWDKCICCDWLTLTHTCLTALCPELPGWAGTKKVKPIWILLKQDTGLNKLKSDVLISYCYYDLEFTILHLLCLIMTSKTMQWLRECTRNYNSYYLNLTDIETTSHYTMW